MGTSIPPAHPIVRNLCIYNLSRKGLKKPQSGLTEVRMDKGKGILVVQYFIIKGHIEGWKVNLTVKSLVYFLECSSYSTSKK